MNQFNITRSTNRREIRYGHTRGSYDRIFSFDEAIVLKNRINISSSDRYNYLVSAENRTDRIVTTTVLVKYIGE